MLKEAGAFPWTLPAREDFGIALIALDEVFDLPDEIKAYIEGSFPNGQPHFRIMTDNPGELAIRLGNVSSPIVRYPSAWTVFTCTRRGMLKWLIMQAWKRGKENNLL